MPKYPKPIQELVDSFRTLPGVGAKSAERFVFRLLQLPADKRSAFAKRIMELTDVIKQCTECGRFDVQTPCSICGNGKRDHTTICVVAEPQDVEAIEKTGEFSGVYHLLGGTLNPLEGIGPDKLAIEKLVARIKKQSPRVQEVIIATNPDLEGESTALYLTRALKPLKVKVTRPAKGLPMGSSIEYADELTLSSALKERKEM